MVKKTRNSKKKFEEEVQFQQGEGESCIPKSSGPRKLPVICYCMTRHLKATIDHTKYPHARTEIVRDMIFATRKEVEKACALMEKENPKYFYYVSTTFRDPSTLDKTMLTKIKKEFHLNRSDI